ncbi:hypothetical protein [Catenisphaera adipataccumulans]|jgi:hypothetical protein|uniref:Uncharacterized protein n=1 Tax=Catenisphaera adipataccumulans TaxID=700500 RepID=A0A7W8CUW0_9FIRM|nr:hypothetical protein [Catenisphaera adipataccumulans]MBB5182025.1 hypothetical protein [Catenisphaera adipataccumulans]
MKFYRGLVIVNILVAVIVLYEVIGYAWVHSHTYCLSLPGDIFLVIICAADIFYCLKTRKK